MGSAPEGASAATGDPKAVEPGSLRVELEDERSFTGQPVSFRDDILVLRTRIDGGEVERGFPKDSIAQLYFPHQDTLLSAIDLVDDGKLVEALPHLDAIWRQRAAFLALLDAETIDLLSSLPAANLEGGDAYRAIGLAKRLLPHTDTTKAANRIHETVLVSHYRLEFYEETEALAREWIQQQPEFPDSALGWKILGDLALREEDFERVIWTVLQPIAMAGSEQMEHLDGCYALAIHAFHQQEEFTRAATLHREMIERRLQWPEGRALQKTGEFYQAVTEDMEKQNDGAAEPDLDLRPPEEDLNLPIRDVRKVLRTRNP